MPPQRPCVPHAARRGAATVARALLGLALASCASTATPPPASWGPEEFDLERRCQQGAGAACGELGASLVQRWENDRDAQRGIVLLEIGCGQGDPGSCTALGLMYGRGFKGDVPKERAVELLSRACEQRWPAGCTGLGEVMLAGATDDKPQARAAMQTGCQLGDARGCELFALSHAGSEFGSSPETAEQFFSLACGRGRRSSCHHLALGKIKDPARRDRGVADLFNNCQQGYAPSCREVAAAFAPLLSRAPDCERAFPLARDACVTGDKEGCAIADACDARSGDRARGVVRLGQACEAGTGLACLYWADAQASAGGGPPQGAAPIDRTQIDRAYLQACKAGAMGAQIACARAAAAELAAATNPEAAEARLTLLRRACGDSVGDACCALAGAHDTGKWLPADATKSSELRAKACGLGHQPCCPTTAPPK